jgi:uncharacterized membrane protein YbhN (UPF0104 family)
VELVAPSEDQSGDSSSATLADKWTGPSIQVHRRRTKEVELQEDRTGTSASSRNVWRELMAALLWFAILAALLLLSFCYFELVPNGNVLLLAVFRSGLMLACASLVALGLFLVFGRHRSLATVALTPIS